ncbi:hypothetical protein AB4043_18040, partial [Terriglobus sp. YAF25]
LPDVPVGHILCEPAARNTAPACGLAAFLMERDEPDTVIGIFPSDHVVKDAGRFAAALRAGIAVAAAGKGEQSSGIYCIPAEFGWNDLGSWAALHEHQRSIAAPGCDQHGNVVDGQGVIALNAKGNYVYAKERTVALVGVNDLVVVETEDALLVTTREHSQDVGKVVKALQELGRKELI